MRWWSLSQCSILTHGGGLAASPHPLVRLRMARGARTVATTAVACVQFVLVALWALVGLMRRGRLATEQAAGWVNAMMWAGGVATALAIGLEVHVLGVLGVSPPAVGVLLSLCIIAGAAFTVLLVVLRRRGSRYATAA